MVKAWQIKARVYTSKNIQTHIFTEEPFFRLDYLFILICSWLWAAWNNHICAAIVVDIGFNMNSTSMNKEPLTAKSFFSKGDSIIISTHDDVIKWKHFPRYWPFVRGIHRSPVNSPHKGQWRGALMFSLICAWINGWVNNRKAGDLRHYRAHHDVIVMQCIYNPLHRTGKTMVMEFPRSDTCNAMLSR